MPPFRCLTSSAADGRQFQRILDDDETSPDKGEELLGALTAADRAHWYLTRRDFFSRGTNRASLLAVEKAAFVVCLDDVDMEFDQVRPWAPGGNGLGSRVPDIIGGIGVPGPVTAVAVYYE